MAIKSNLNFNSFNLLSSLLLVLYLCLGFVPNLEAVDKIAPQWVGMSLLNLISIITFYYYRYTLTKTIRASLFSWMSITYIGFILWAALSYIYAINQTEVIVNITRQINVLFMFLSMSILFFNIKKKPAFVSWVIAAILGIEVYSVLQEALQMIDTTGFISSGNLKGVTANRNITAFSIAVKIPFVLYLVLSIKKVNYKIILGVLILLTCLALSMIQSRASFIGLGLTFFSYLLLNVYIFFKNGKAISQLFKIGYFLVPLLLALIINQTIIADKGADVISRAATISISTEDGSINQRLRYYRDVLTHLSSNPIFGVGLGNWKLKSIDYDSKDIDGYVVPYHAHSDFIQLGAELGIIGFLLYLGIFLWAGYYVYVLIRFSKISLEEKVFLFLLITALGVYSIDASLNFPIARPQVLVSWSAIMALIMIYYQNNIKAKKLNGNKNLSLIFIGVALICIIPSLYITNTVYKSLKGQMFLLQDFNSNQFNIPINQVESFVPKIPNITVTTIPINSVKARYFVNAKNYKKALSLIERGTGANPYLYYSEILKSQIYQELGKLDSAKIYAREAFFGLPNNDLHSTRYVNLINQTRDKSALNEAFDLLTINNKLNNWKNYLVIASSFKAEVDPLLIERANRALEIFPDNGDIQRLHSIITIGEKKLAQSIEFSNKGLELFNKQDYKNSAEEFEKALELNPLNYAYYENAATSNYMIGNLQEALNQINKVINDLNPLNGKCEYIKALIFIKMQDPIGACPLLETAMKSGFSQAQATLKQYCNSY